VNGRSLVGIASRCIRSFWGLQVTGWSLYALVYNFNMAMFRPTASADLIRIAATMFIGFGCTCLLRLWYRAYDIHGTSLGGLAWRVVLGSVMAAPVWFFSARFAAIASVKGSAAFVAWLGKGSPFRFAYPLFMDSVVMTIWGALYFSVKLWRDWEAQVLRSRESKRTAQASQFQTLRYQLNPHFLFNALNSIRALITEDKTKAKRTITDLSEFLRYSLLSRDRPIVPLSREIDAIERYLAIERIRYEDKLRVELKVEPAAAEFPVVGFLVHPLVENAVRHGMKTSPMPLTVSLSAGMDGDGLKIVVRNTGRWIEKDSHGGNGRNPENGNGNGNGKMNGNGNGNGKMNENGNGNGNGNGTRLDCIREILETLYPGNHRLERVMEDGGVRVELELHKRLDNRDEETLQGFDCR
jgi:two-component system, LytTR family, sensor kinase